MNRERLQGFKLTWGGSQRRKCKVWNDKWYLKFWHFQKVPSVWALQGNLFNIIFFTEHWTVNSHLVIVGFYLIFPAGAPCWQEKVGDVSPDNLIGCSHAKWTTTTATAHWKTKHRKVPVLGPPFPFPPAIGGSQIEKLL